MAEAIAQSADADCLYGSVATGQYTRTSDVDLVLVAEDLPPFFQRFKLFTELYELCPRLDLLVYTPAEFRSQLAMPAGFWSDFKKSALRII